MSKHLQKRLQALLAEEMDRMAEIYAEDGARLLGCDNSGSDSGSGSGRRSKNRNRNGACRDLLRREGLDIGDTIVILTEGGTVITGVLVAEVGDRAIRVLTTLANGIPANTLLNVDCRDIAAIGETVGIPPVGIPGTVQT
ncbi:MAG: hypothetical protein ACOY94_15430 [Bacillota bacterium]